MVVCLKKEIYERTSSYSKYELVLEYILSYNSSLKRRTIVLE